MSDQVALGGNDTPVSALPQPSVSGSLISSGTLTQSFQSNVSTVVSVQNARRLTLLVKHTAHASATDGVVHVLVMLANTATAPAIGDDSWFAAPVSDIASTDADIAAGATLVTGADYSKGPNWRSYAVGGLILKTMPASSAEVVRQRMPAIDVSDARWMYAAAIQQGDTTNFGTVAIDYVTSL